MKARKADSREVPARAVGPGRPDRGRSRVGAAEASTPPAGKAVAASGAAPVNDGIEARLHVVLRENCLPNGASVSIGDAENLFDAGILDSAALLFLVGVIEQDFGLTIPDEDLLPEHFSSVGAIAAYVRARKGIPPPGKGRGI